MKGKILNRKPIALLVSLAFIASAVLVGLPGTAVSQTVVTTIPVGDTPYRHKCESPDQQDIRG